MKYTTLCVNKFFKGLRSHGVWIPYEDKMVIAQYGQDFAETSPGLA